MRVFIIYLRKIASNPRTEFSRRLPACQTILNAIRNLLADGCQLKEFLFVADVFGFSRKLPIYRSFVPKVIVPIHASHYM